MAFAEFAKQHLNTVAFEPDFDRQEEQVFAASLGSFRDLARALDGVTNAAGMTLSIEAGYVETMTPNAFASYHDGDQEDIAHIYKHLKFADIQFVTLSEGLIDEMHIGLKGTMNSLFLKQLARKTHRGLQGRAIEGKSAGGKSYGYQTLRKFNAKGEVIEEERRIVPEEADVVRRIFRTT